MGGYMFPSQQQNNNQGFIGNGQGALRGPAVNFDDFGSFGDGLIPNVNAGDINASSIVNQAGMLKDAGLGDVQTPGFDWAGQDWGGMAKGFGSVAQGVGGLAQAWQGMQGLKLAKKQMKTQNAQWEKNYAAQRDDIAHDRNTRSNYRNQMRGGRVV